MNFKICTYGSPEADRLLIQMVDDHDMSVIEQEIAYIKAFCPDKDFCLKVVKVNSWNKDLPPWPAPPVFGNEAFGDGAAYTLQFLLNEVIPAGASEDPKTCKHIYMGGYSLAGLFALWTGYQTDVFGGIAAASPSIWYPHFTDYMRENKMQPGRIYLSLGDKEERTRNPVMSQVGTAIREAEDILKSDGKDCILEWNKGNHFKEPDLRTARAFAWLMNRE